VPRNVVRVVVWLVVAAFGALAITMAARAQRTQGSSCERSRIRPQPFRHGGVFMKVVHLILEVLREIFDEAAYARFLRRGGVGHSQQAYVDFLREKYIGPPRPRCC